MKFEHVSIYNGVGFKKKLKAPTDHCFVLKVHDSCILRCTTEAICRFLLKIQKDIYVKIHASPRPRTILPSTTKIVLGFYVVK